ncbi:MAG: tRNA (adenosine(37)-N6)-threonylcarbamoyltransferase complex dimerization subunit type 1 TsaB [Calditrichaeota bacterium]|nr:tRNA (adenosine(37)-N6)-threonylcarbamoyltransferase complex dimerization subunit type 1 TsaB [Calditrichota bacterium]
MILAIETSSNMCSVAICLKDKVLFEANHSAPMQHATLIGQMVEKGLKEIQGEITGVAVGIGPGSFTGLRIGMSYAQGLCFGRNIPIAGISNHQVLAMQADNQTIRLFTIIDARRQEVYLAEHKLDSLFSIQSHKIVAMDELTEIIPAGVSLVAHQDVKLSENILEKLQRSKIHVKRDVGYFARDIAHLAQKKFDHGLQDEIDNLEPMYIRPFAGAQ